jgi:protocatechuate 4,5-dioxygenase beta chain
VAKLVAILATTHHPFFYKTSRLPADEAPPFAAEWVRKVEAYRATLTAARPDVLVMVGSDHFHQLWLDNMPQFLVGKAPHYDGNYYNEDGSSAYRGSC